MGMTPDEEELRPDRRIGFETDDEDNQAEMSTGDDEDSSDSENTLMSSRQSSQCSDSHLMPWPQSYKQSMDMLSSVIPPSVSFTPSSSLGDRSVSSPQAYRRPQRVDYDSSLTKQFISPENLEKEEVPVLTREQSSKKFSDHEQPTTTQQCSYAQSLLNGVNILCGVGLLSTPFAVMERGWISMFVLALLGVISCYTGILLKRCLEHSPGLYTYPDIGQSAFGLAGRLTMAIILYIELYVCCVEYVILMSDNLSQVFPNAQINISGIPLSSHCIFAIATTIIVLPTVWLRNLNLLSYLSAVGVVASLLVASCLLWVGIVDEIGFHARGTAFDIANFPVAFGIYSFCYAGHSVFPNIYSSMREKSKFSAVLISSFIICFIMYAGVAICGFAMFGDAIQSQFTLNMPQDLLASKIAVWTTVLNPLSKYSLTMTPVAMSLEEFLPSAHRGFGYASIFIRTVLVLSTLVVAITVPFFGFVMAFIGSFLSMLVALIFPCACYVRIHRSRLNLREIAVCVFIMMLGVACSCIGTYTSVRRIMDEMSS